jgi:Tol biopolymer transport system component
MNEDERSSTREAVTLDSWKAIAAHLKRDVRTVRRWEKLEGLPVRRHLHQSRSSVYAYPSEIDAWAASRQPRRQEISAWRRAAPSIAFAAVLMLSLLLVADAPFSATALAQQQPGMTSRRVWTGDTSGTVSPDGRYISYSDWETSSPVAEWGTLRVRDIATGTDRALATRTGESRDRHSYASAISRDGAQVAYDWCRRGDGDCEIRTVNLRGGSARRVFDSGAYVEPKDWSPDGKWIAVILANFDDHTTQIGLLAVQDGSLRVLKSVDWRGPNRVFFSPDSRNLGFDLPASDTSNERDVFVLAVDGSREVPAVVYPSRDTMMGWSPDGKHLLFASDRGGSIGLWALPFTEGKPGGAPVLVKANIGDAWSMGVTSAGALYMGVSAGDRDIQVSSIDLTRGTQIGPSVKPIQNFVGSNRLPTWSRDGKYLAYISTRGVPDGWVIGIRSLETGEIQELRPRLLYPQGLSWAPDGRSFVLFARDLKGREGVFRVDAHTAEVVPIVVPVAERLSYEGFFWSPDGKRLYYHSQAGTIYERDLTSGKEREVIRGPFGPISLSPDGRWIAASKRDSPNHLGAVVLIPVDGGEQRELLRLTEPQQWINNTSMPWTPDGRAILVRKMLAAGGETSELWLVPIADGLPRKLDFDANRVAPYAPGRISLSPNGRQVAFVSGRWKSEVWVLEDFLPALK